MILIQEFMDIDLLSKMVRELILDREEVTLPGLGTFVAELIPSSFSDRGYTINPPYKRLGFRQRENAEDNVLVDFYSSNNNVDKEKASRIVTEFLAELKQVLEQKKSVVFPGLGRLRATRENNFFFVADEDLDIYPEGFGLEPVSLKTHEETPAEVSATMAALHSILNPEPEVSPASEIHVADNPGEAQTTVQTAVQMAVQTAAQTAAQTAVQTAVQAAVLVETPPVIPVVAPVESPSDIAAGHAEEVASEPAVENHNVVAEGQTEGGGADLSVESPTNSAEGTQGGAAGSSADGENSVAEAAQQADAPAGDDNPEPSAESQGNAEPAGESLHNDGNAEQAVEPQTSLESQNNGTVTPAGESSVEPQGDAEAGSADSGKSETGSAEGVKPDPVVDTPEPAEAFAAAGEPSGEPNGNAEQSAAEGDNTTEGDDAAENSNAIEGSNVAGVANAGDQSEGIADETDEKGVVTSRRHSASRTIAWTVGILLLLAVLFLVVFVILAHTSPEFIDSILYTPEELEIINS